MFFSEHLVSVPCVQMVAQEEGEGRVDRRERRKGIQRAFESGIGQTKDKTGAGNVAVWYLSCQEATVVVDYHSCITESMLLPILDVGASVRCHA